MTGTSIWRATRSAVRCRVPVSDVGMLGSGTRCTLPRATREQSAARMRAPSILASSESRWGVNSASRRNPPEHTDSTSGPSPTTISAPLLAWRMRSIPSRRGVPGATIRNASSSASDRRKGTSGSPSRVVAWPRLSGRPRPEGSAGRPVRGSAPRPIGSGSCRSPAQPDQHGEAADGRPPPGGRAGPAWSPTWPRRRAGASRVPRPTTRVLPGRATTSRRCRPSAARPASSSATRSGSTPASRRRAGRSGVLAKPVAAAAPAPRSAVPRSRYVASRNAPAPVEPEAAAAARRARPARRSPRRGPRGDGTPCGPRPPRRRRRSAAPGRSPSRSARGPTSGRPRPPTRRGAPPLPGRARSGPSPPRRHR